jgi:hypothetical protein
MMKHVEQNHVVVFKRFGKEQQPRFQGFLFFNHELATKWENVLASFFFKYFFKFNPFLENHETQKWFLDDVMLFVINGFLSLRAMECVWLQNLVLWLCYPTMSFPSKRIFTKKVIHALNKTFIELCNLC